MSRSRRVLRTVVALPALVLVLALRAYQLVLSPMVGPVCRYAPSCSSYAVTAVRERGAVVGSLMAARRLLSCHPWAAGGWDPVPPRRPRGRPCGAEDPPEGAHDRHDRHHPHEHDHQAPEPAATTRTPR